MSGDSLAPEERRGPVEVHSTAIVRPGAVLEPGVRVGSYAVIAGDVVVGPGTQIGPHAVIEDGVRIGADNEISTGATLGVLPPGLPLQRGAQPAGHRRPQPDPGVRQHQPGHG